MVIAGVCGDAKYRALRETIQPTYYVLLDEAQAGNEALIFCANYERPASSYPEHARRNRSDRTIVIGPGCIDSRSRG
jgi:hypothetical protein